MSLLEAMARALPLRVLVREKRKAIETTFYPTKLAAALRFLHAH